jgi:hypothetical protein
MPRSTEVNRRVFFYRMYFERAQSGRAIDADAILSLIDRIGELRFDTGERYLKQSDGRAVSVWPQGNRSGRLVIGTIRSTGLPELEHMGERSPLDIQQKRLLESTH